MGLLISDLLDLHQTEHAALFENRVHPWEVLPQLGKYLASNLKPSLLGKVSPLAVLEGDIHLGEGSVVEPGAYIKGPAWIGSHCEIRKGAYLRGNVIVGNECILGNSCEFKNSLLFNKVQVPHFAYVGDSVLGFGSHLASGVTLSNLKITPGNVEIFDGGKRIDTGLRKMGAIVGDGAEVGCHSVLNPGSIIGKRSLLYAGISWRGVCPPNTVVKLKQEHDLTSRRE